jgi:hypothetical protein
MPRSRWNLRPTDRRALPPKATRLVPVLRPRTSGGRKAVRHQIPAAESLLPDVRKAFEQAINKKAAVPRGDKTVLMTRIEIGLEQLLNQFAKGERQARRDLIEYADKLGIDFLANHKQTLERALKPNYQTILDSYVARRSENVTPAPHTLAPPELLDDDAAEPEPTKPDLNKPVSRMTSSEKLALYEKLCAEDAERAKAKANKP